MSLDNGDPVLEESPVETTQEFQQKKSKVSYLREFLLSLSELDVCKKLPSGFDASILSEFEDCSSSTLEWQRSLGGLPLQSSRHNDGSLPPNRPDSSSSYPRGNAARWDVRTSGLSDRDGNPQPDRDMQDSGRRFANQPRRLWQQPEHDGLLGSGAFPRPSGCTGASALRPRGNDHYQLSKSTEPYQPPRQYKVVPYSRKEFTDSVNNETFGSSECTSKDKVEEERKRRASFESMRKEQHQALQEMQNQNPENRKEKLGTDIIALLEKSEDSEHVKHKKEEEKSDVSMASSLLQNDSSRLSSHIQTPASRPLVPPGFASAMLEKNLSTQPSSTPIEDGHTITEDNIPVDSDPGKKSESTTGVEASKDSVGLETVSFKTSGLQEGNRSWEDALDDLSSKKESMPKTVDTVSQDQSASILEKLFGGNSTRNKLVSPHFIEHQGAKLDEETWDPSVSKSSKFAHWFFEEEKRLKEDFLSSNLLSLIVSDEKVGSQSAVISDDKATEHSPPTIPCKNDEAFQKLLAFPAASSIPEPYFQSDKRDCSSVVFTCEDLEQSILAEAKESSSGLQHSISEHWAILDGNSEGRKADVDDRASQHLLSLLQGTNTKESVSLPKADAIASFGEPAVSDTKACPNFSLVDNGTIKNSEPVQKPEKTLTLESLFGTAFMSELHSVGAPVSTQRGSVGRIEDGDVAQPHGMPFPQEAEVFLSSTSGEHQSNKIVHEVNSETFSRIEEAKAHKIPGLWFGHEESVFEGLRSVDKGYEEGAFEIQLPEEDSLITVGDSLHPIVSDTSPFRDVNRIENLLPRNAPEELNKSILNTILRGERKRAHGLGALPLSHGPCDLIESHNLHHFDGRLPSHFLEQTNHMRPMFPQMDYRTNRSPQMKLMGPESIRHNPLHPFPPNVIPQHAFPNAASPRFDPPPRHLLLQHMSMPENFPPHHPLHGLPRDVAGVPLSQPINHMPGYMPEINNLRGIPLNHRQPNYGIHGLGMPGSVVGGGGNPEALQRLIELELRANQKQIHPAGVGHIPAIFSPEVDMGFRYR